VTGFEQNYFQKQKFIDKQISQYFASARRDMEIAESAGIAEVRFKFAYDALIKIGIAVIAEKGYKVRSQPGHHVKILEKMSEILNDENISVLGNKMRQDRNRDFYEGGTIITKKEANEYLEFLKGIFNEVQNRPSDEN